MGAGGVSLAILDQQGMLQHYAPHDLGKIGPNYRDAANPPAWVGMDVWAATICFNTIEAEKQGLGKPVELARPDPARIQGQNRGALTRRHPGRGFWT